MNQQLRELMDSEFLTCNLVSELSGYSLHSIRAYRLPNTSKRHRKLSERTYKAIKQEIDAYLSTQAIKA